VRSRSKVFPAAILFAAFALGYGYSSDIYIAQSGAGAVNGADCADAYGMSWFNTPSNWGTSVGQIGPGSTVHLCGTFTAPAGAGEYLVFHGSGTIGSPITLLFERGAVITAPYWGGPVIDLTGKSYLVVDGGTNGEIQASDNGTNKTYQQDYGACVVSRIPGVATTVTVQNLTCSNLYIDASPSDNGGQSTVGLDIWNVSNVVLKGNTLHDVKWASRASYSVGYTYSGFTYTGNNIYNIDHALFVTDSDPTGSALMSGFYIYDNTLGSMVNWDNTANYNHHDWFHLNASSPASSLSDFFIYNNLGSGDVGFGANAGIFAQTQSGGTSLKNFYIFNNVFINTSSGHCWANGPVGLAGTSTSLVANNTFASQTTTCKDNGIIYDNPDIGLTSENNIFQSTQNAALYGASGTSISGIDYNDFYQSAAWFLNGSWYFTLSNWQSGSGYDKHSTTGNPQLTSSYHLQGSASTAWQTGASLYVMCTGQVNPGIGALCLDRAGVKRPSTGPWDMGAYEDSAEVPNPPNALTSVAQ
jgi:hypothetical protein